MSNTVAHDKCVVCSFTDSKTIKTTKTILLDIFRLWRHK